MISRPQKFDDRLVKLITFSLPDSAIPGRLQLLQRVLNEWSTHHLPTALWRPDPQIVDKQLKTLKQINKHAVNLLGVLDVLDKENITFALIHQLSLGDTGENRTKIARLTASLNEHRSFLNSIYLATSDLKGLSRGKDQRLNLPAYFVMKDIAAIFEWVTGIPAVRRTERGTDTFGKFAGAMWPVVFGSDDGLQSALKNWAKYGGKSPLLVNIDMQHPTWGVFDV